jgi:hypothetical protein
MTSETKIATLEKSVLKLTEELSFALLLILKLAREREVDDLFRESDFKRIEEAEQQLRELADTIR